MLQLGVWQGHIYIYLVLDRHASGVCAVYTVQVAIYHGYVK